MLTGILLTRPDGLNQALARALQLRQVSYQITPLIEITQLDVQADARLLIEDLDRNDIIIFVSRQAVRFGLPVLERYWPQWPQLQWLSVGPGTAEELKQLGIASVFPDSPGSEGLLELAQLHQPEGKQILIVSGHGGRALLGDTLSNQGALVQYLAVYERRKVGHAGLWQRMREAGIDTIVVSSVQILDSFSLACSVRHRQDVQLIATSTRIGEQAIRQGYNKVHVADDASTDGLLKAIETLVIRG